MKKFTLVILFLIASQNIFAQSGWQWVNPLPQGNDLQAIEFLNSKTGYAAGSAGTIIKTTNGGVSWNTYYARFDSLGVPITYSNLCIADTSILYAYGSYASLYVNSKLIKSTNGGVNWMQITKPSGVNDMYFLNANTGFIVSGGIFKTTNGGANWNNNFQTSDASYSIKFINNQTGFASFAHYGSTYNQYIMKTTNQGLSWYQTYSQLSYGEIRDISFNNFQTGYAISSNVINSYILKTTNFGEVWDSIASAPIRNYAPNLVLMNNNILFASWSYGNKEFLFKTTNEGLIWKSDTLVGTELKLSFPSNDTGYYVGWGGVILKTTNAGTNWISQVSNYPSIGATKNIMFPDYNTGYITCDSGAILKTTDKGASWSILHIGNYNLNAMHFVNSQIGYVASYYEGFGTNNKIFKTTNGGLYWDTLNISTLVKSINSIYFINNNTGFYTSGTTQLIKTADGGATWFPIDLPIGATLFNTGGIHFINSLTGYFYRRYSQFTGEELQILKTTNGGDNWSIIYRTTEAASSGIIALKFISENVGYYNNVNIVNGALFKTQDGGLSWTRSLYVGTNSNINYLDLNNVYCGSYKSTNSGLNWTLYDTHIQSISSIHFVDKNTGILIGGNGAGIMRTTDGGEIISSISSQQAALLIPDNFLLHQNYPNPFNPSTKINYEIKSSGFVSLKVFDLLGKEVAVLVNEKQNAGSYAVDFNSSEFNLPSGIYFYTLNAGEFKETRKMVLVK